MLTTRSYQSVVIALLLLLLLVGGQSHAAERRAWVTLTNCQYVVTKAGDGDSFRVHSGTNEFNLRLYYVDAPEATLT